MKKNYFKLILVVIVAVACLAATTVKAQETMKFDSEAKKLEFVRQMLAKEKYLCPGGDKPVPHCELMMKDLLAGKNFKAIEPDVRVDSADDSRLAKWKKCEDEMISPLGFHSLNDLGGPPYRYYKIELDGNKKNGPEDMIYYNMSKDIPLSGTGYVWMDGCEVKRTFTIIGALQNWSDKPNAVYLNTLVHYKGKLWVAELVDGHGFKLFRWLDNRQEGCLWFIFKSEQEEKAYYKKYSSIKETH